MDAPPPGSRAEALRQAALDLVSERGSYDAIELRELLDRGGVDRDWFERHFAGRDACLIWAATVELHAFTARLWAVYNRHQCWRDGVRAAAYEMADVIREDPRFPVVTTVALGYGGDLAQVERDAAVVRMVDLIDLGRQEMADPSALGRSPAELVVGAIFNALRAAAVADDIGDTDALVPQFMFMAVRPYLGEAEARAELTMPHSI
jgi:hypothetical protein